MSIDSRLREVIRELGVAHGEFAREIGVSPGALSEACSGKRPAPWAVVFGIANRYPEVSLEWLLTGRGRWHRERAPPCVREPAAPAYGDARLQEIQGGLLAWWARSSDDERAWLTVELRRRYPEIWG
jgi:transcriptional regulator with XRE-family HTH domain